MHRSNKIVSLSHIIEIHFTNQSMQFSRKIADRLPIEWTERHIFNGSAVPSLLSGHVLQRAVATGTRSYKTRKHRLLPFYRTDLFYVIAQL